MRPPARGPQPNRRYAGGSHGFRLAVVQRSFTPSPIYSLAARVISRLPGGPGSFSVRQPAARKLRRNWP